MPFSRFSRRMLAGPGRSARAAVDVSGAFVALLWTCRRLLLRGGGEPVGSSGLIPWPDQHCPDRAPERLELSIRAGDGRHLCVAVRPARRAALQRFRAADLLL